MMQHLQKLRALSLPDQLLLLRAIIAFPVVAGMQRFLGVRRCQSILGWLNPWRPGGVDFVSNLKVAANIAQLVSIAARHGFIAPNCLDRSLVLWSFMRNQGLEGQIRYGARTSVRGFEAHAWVELADKVIGDKRNIVQEFVPFECTLVSRYDSNANVLQERRASHS